MQPVVIGDVMWEPSPEVIARSRLKRFMDRHGIETFEELLRRADDDIEWFGDAAIKALDVAFYRPYEKVVDLSQGKAWARWWVGARMNIVHSCLDRHRDGELGDKPALIFEGEPGDVRRLTYRELDQQVSRLAGVPRGARAQGRHRPRSETPTPSGSRGSGAGHPCAAAGAAATCRPATPRGQPPRPRGV